MRRTPATLLPRVGGLRHRGVWRHAVLASLWNVPATLRLAAQQQRGLLAVPLLSSNNSSSGSSSGDPAQQEDAGVLRFFRRRGRATRTSCTTPCETDDMDEVQTDVNGKTEPSANRAMSGYRGWSARTGSCTAEEFLQGVQQSYYGLGVLIGTLAEAARPQLPLGKGVPLSGALAQLKTLLSKHYSVSLPTQTAEGSAGEKESNNVATTTAVSEALMKVLPLSSFLAKDLYNAWNKQRTFDANIFSYAGPTDYVLSTKMLLFVECQSMKNVFTADDSTFQLIHVAPSSPLEDDAKKNVSGSESGQSEANADSRLAAEAKPPKENEATAASSASATDTATTADANANKGKGTSSIGKTIIVYNGHILPPIPADAVACVVASVDVVAPPQRYAPSFDWFYQRITGCDNEYERIAAAQIFGMTNVRTFVAPFDFLARMLTGRHIELAFPEGVKEMLRIPKNIDECPPATRKVMCFYMDADRRWVLSGLHTVDVVLTTMLPKAASA
ncbi:hypothetical protein DQ04_07091020 [Trypanosoma grayi]|uniref:hypothetical protein n=1 Tax=Trypanosoma grayi TaxID=71804 RepID=UPI0004F43071|nr:hypothetical protein DQ04_07091020 [Trypanosoma grayi]KEG08480.1 hypothetical protein DQ04_07091020 [Trypanosoma grayi]